MGEATVINAVTAETTNLPLYDAAEMAQRKSAATLEPHIVRHSLGGLLDVWVRGVRYPVVPVPTADKAWAVVIQRPGDLHDQCLGYVTYTNGGVYHWAIENDWGERDSLPDAMIRVIIRTAHLLNH